MAIFDYGVIHLLLYRKYSKRPVEIENSDRTHQLTYNLIYNYTLHTINPHRAFRSKSSHKYVK